MTFTILIIAFNLTNYLRLEISIIIHWLIEFSDQIFIVLCDLDELTNVYYPENVLQMLIVTVGSEIASLSESSLAAVSSTCLQVTSKNTDHNHYKN